MVMNIGAKYRSVGEHCTIAILAVRAALLLIFHFLTRAVLSEKVVRHYSYIY